MRIENLEKATYKCAICPNVITEEQLDNPADQNINPLNKTNVIGGKLFKNRPTGKSIDLFMAKLGKNLKEGKRLNENITDEHFIGGICDSCLQNNEAVKILNEHEQIKFEPRF